MIPREVVAVEEVSDDLPVVEEIDFTIGDPRKMMRVGAKQYSHPDRAAVQEVACNGWDAHVEAGNTHLPIEVTLPTVYNTEFVCKDYGNGMSLEDFRKVYTVFGYSTKEHTDDQTGNLGLGSKAPLAYTDTFTVASVKNGMKVIGVVVRKPDWSISLKVVAHHKTDEPNGTEIRFDVKDVESFNQKANDLFKFWLPGRVKVNGREPEHYVGHQIATGLYEARDWNQSYVVMGNVAYRIINATALFSESKINAMNFVAYVEMTDGVDFTPSREDLEYTERTLARLRRLISDFEAEILAKATAEIDAATTHAEAYAAWSKWTDLLGSSLFADLSFKGDKFVNHMPINAMRYQTGGGRYSTYRINGWYVNNMDNALIVTGFKPILATPHKVKAKDWANMKGINPSYILFTADNFKNPWVDPARIVDWETVQKEAPKKPRVASGGGANAGRVKGSWDYYSAQGAYLSEKPLPDDGDIFYVSVQTDNNTSVSTIIRTLVAAGKMDKDASVIVVPKNRLNKFLRENGKVPEFSAWAKTHVVKNGVSLLSEDAKKAMGVGDYYETQWLNYLDASKIDDPEWSKEIDLLKKKAELTKAYQANLDLARIVGAWYDVKQYNPTVTTPMLTKYPLLRSVGRVSSLKQDLYLYINAKHAASKKGN